MSQFDIYKQFYPDKWAAISALRRDTGLGFDEANRIINDLFGMTDDDERRADDAEQEALYQAQEAQNAGTADKKSARLTGAGLYGVLKSIFSSSKKCE